MIHILLEFELPEYVGSGKDKFLKASKLSYSSHHRICSLLLHKEVVGHSSWNIMQDMESYPNPNQEKTNQSWVAKKLARSFVNKCDLPKSMLETLNMGKMPKQN